MSSALSPSESVPPTRVFEPIVAEPDTPVGRVPEAVVQDAWARQLFDPTALATTTGERVLVLNPGIHNHGSGPDFSGATLRIGTSPEDLLWAGDIEIHTTSADWNRHRHHEDPAYDRVVLHVVLSPDRATGSLTRSDGTPLPEMVLLPHLDRSLRALIHDFHVRGTRTAPYCAPRWKEVPESDRRAWIRSVGIQRIRERAERLAQAFGHTPDLDRLLVGGLWRALGYSPNADAMERLVMRLPLDLARRLDDPQDVQALVMGLAGLSDPRLFSDDLTARFRHLRTQHELPTPMAPEAWRHGGRPANAPRARLAQASAWLSASGDRQGFLRHEPLARLRACLDHPRPVDALRALLREAAVDGVPPLGRPRTDVALLNAVLPALLLDAEIREDHGAEAEVLAVLDALPPEANHITRAFSEEGLEPSTALESQGAYQLAGAYCDEGHCGRCAIGQRLYPALAGT